MTETDAELVERASALDREAFAELYNRYFDRVYDFLARMVRDRDEAADLAQETFLRAMNSLGSLQKGTSFKSWIFTIARNQALNRLERAGRTRPLGGGGEDDDDAPAYDVPDPSAMANPAAAAEANELAAIVWEAASALDAKQYSLLDLHVRQGLESAEIAEVLGVTRNNAYVMVNRLKQALSEAVGALVLFRSGRGRCPELDAIITRLESVAMSPDTRKAIDRHAAKCAECAEQRRKTLPLAAFGGLSLVQAPEGAKAHILDAMLQSWPPAPTAAGNPAGTEATNPASHALPGGSGQGATLPGPAGFAPTAGQTGSAFPAGVGDGAGNGVARGSSGSAAWRRTRRGGLYIGGAAAVLLIALFGVIAVFGGGSGDTVADAESIPPTPPAGTSGAGLPSGTVAPATQASGTAAATATPTPTPPGTAAAGAPTTTTATAAAPTTSTGGAINGGATGTTAPSGAPNTPTAPPIAPNTPVPASPTATPTVPVTAPPSPSTTAPPPPLTTTPPPAVTTVPPLVTTTPSPVTPTVTVTPSPPLVTTTPPTVLCARSFTVSPRSLSLVGGSATGTVLITDTSSGCSSGTAITAVPGASWMVVNPTTVILPPGGTATIAVSMNPNNLPRSSQTSQVTISGGGATATVSVTYRPALTPSGPGGFTTGD